MKKVGLEVIPSSDAYPDAAAVIILDHIYKRQFFGFYSLWDTTYQEERYRLWKILNPEEKRLQQVRIDLGSTGTLEEFELTVFTPDGELTKIKQNQVTVKETSYPEGGTAYKQGIVDLPALTRDTVVEMKYIIKFKEPLC